MPVFDERTAAQQAFRKEAMSRRLHDKEFHAKQSIRKRQQEYDQAVKDRLLQDAALSSSKNSIGSTRAHAGANHAQHAEQLPDVTARVGAAGLMSGPRAKKLQAFVRHPRPPQLPAPPRQPSRIPDDLLLPEIVGRPSKQSTYNSDSMANLLMDDDQTRQQSHEGIGVSSPQESLLPRLVSQKSGMRRLTQELPS